MMTEMVGVMQEIILMTLEVIATLVKDDSSRGGIMEVTELEELSTEKTTQKGFAGELKGKGLRGRPRLRRIDI